MVCGANTPGDYVPNLGHGALCGTAAILTLVTPLAVQPPAPSHNVSEVAFALGGAFPFQTQTGNPFSNGGAPSGYGSRIDAMAIEMGSSINVIEPYGTGIFTQLTQEGGGIGSQGEVEILDAGQGCFFALGNSVQNSGIEKVHCAGANADYTMQELIENTSAYRAEVDASANGPMQLTPWASICGICHLATPFATQTPTITIGNIGCEDVFWCVHIENASAFVYNILISSQATRRGKAALHLGTWAHDVTSSLLQPGGAPGIAGSGCAVWNDAKNGGACRTPIGTTVGWYNWGNVAGLGGSNASECSTDASVGCSYTFYSAPTSSSVAIKPPSDSITAIQGQKAAGTPFFTFDSMNSRFRVGDSSSPTATFDVSGQFTVPANGLVSTYAGLPTVGAGLGPFANTTVVANLAVTASHLSTTLYTTGSGTKPGSAGTYQACATAWVPLGLLGATVTFTIGYNNGTAQTSPLFTLAVSNGSTATGCQYIHSVASSSITLSANTPSTGTYHLDATLMAVQ